MMKNANQYSVMMTTAGERGEAERIAAMLVEKKLAACVQFLPIESVYMWKGKIQTSNEFLLLIKTTRNRVENVQNAIRSVHSYETPEIISMRIEAGASEYLTWVDEIISR